MTTKTTFLVPNFKKGKDKVNHCIAVCSPNVLELADKRGWCRPAIATTGFSASDAGTYVFAITVKKNVRNGVILVGFTDTETFDSAGVGYAGGNFSGTSLNCFSGHRFPRDADYLSSNVTSKASEIVCIFKISPGLLFGYRYTAQWIVDENEGVAVDCTNDFGSGNEIFPCISLASEGQQVEFISFNEIKSRSPFFDKYYNQKQVVPQPSTPSLAQLQQEVDKEKKRANELDTQLQQKNQQLETEKKNSASKDEQLQQEKKNHSSLAAQLQTEKQDASSHLQHKDHQLQLQEQLHRQKDQLLLQEQQRNRQVSARLQQNDQLIQQQAAEIERLRQLVKDKH